MLSLLDINTKKQEKFNLYNPLPYGTYSIHFTEETAITKYGTFEEPNHLYIPLKETYEEEKTEGPGFVSYDSRSEKKIINERDEIKVTPEGIYYHGLLFINENNQNLWNEKIKQSNDFDFDFDHTEMPQSFKIEGKNIVHVSRSYLTSSFIIIWHQKFGIIEKIPFKITYKKTDIEFFFE